VLLEQTVNPPQPTAALRLAAPDLARRVGLTLGGLASAVAAHLYRIPLLAALTVPVWTRINRARHRLERLLTQLAAGKLPQLRRAKPHQPGTRAPEAAAPEPAAPEPPAHPPLPRRWAWLIEAVGYHAAGYASQLQHLLADPAMAEVLATVPAAGRIVRPLLRMLGLPADLVPRPPGAAPARPPPRPKPARRIDRAPSALFPPPVAIPVDAPPEPYQFITNVLVR
jgi:HAMP domain-containing protein